MRGSAASPHSPPPIRSDQQGVLALLNKIIPPELIIHVGAGTGTGEFNQWQAWPNVSAIVIDAEENRLFWTKTARENRVWHVANVVLDATEHEADYFYATNPDESGLLSPELLTDIWPNLHTRSRNRRRTQRLDHLLNAMDCDVNIQHGQIWAFFDCFPARRILEGCGDELYKWSVVCLRVLLTSKNEGLTDATLESVMEFLLARGFKCVQLSEERHPAVGHAVFLQDWSTRIREFNIAEEALRTQAIGLQKRVDVLVGVRDAQTKLVKERQAQIEASRMTEQALRTQATELQKRIEVLIEERDAQTKLAKERQAQVEASHMAEEASRMQVAELQKRIETLTLECDAKAELASQQEQIYAEVKQRLQYFEAEYIQATSQQTLLTEELSKAEAQIELIKDLLLKES